MIGAIIQIAQLAAKDIGGGIVGGVKAKRNRERAIEQTEGEVADIEKARDESRKEFDIFASEERDRLNRKSIETKQYGMDLERQREELIQDRNENRIDQASEQLFGESDAFGRLEQESLKRRRIGG